MMTLYGEDPREPRHLWQDQWWCLVCTVDDTASSTGFDLLYDVGLDDDQRHRRWCLGSSSTQRSINRIERHLRETGELEAAQQQIAAQWRASGQPLPQYVGDDKPTGDRALRGSDCSADAASTSSALRSTRTFKPTP